jgi:hypothetical protein
MRHRQHILLRLHRAWPSLHCKTVDPPKKLEEEFKSKPDKMIRSGSTPKTAGAL